MRALLLRLPLDRPGWVLALYALLCGAAGWGLGRLTFETDMGSMLPGDHPAIVFEREFSQTFDDREPVLVAVRAPGPAGVYRVSTLASVRRIADRLEALDEIQAGSVVTLYTVGEGSAFGGPGARLPRRPPDDAAGAARVRAAVEARPDLYRDLVASDGSATLVIARLVSRDAVADLYDRLLAIVAEEVAPGDEGIVTGMPVVEGLIDRSMRHDLARMAPAALGAIVLILAVVFRSVRGVVLPLVLVASAVVWTLGTMAALGVPLYAMTSMLPTVLLAVGTAQAIHVLTRYDQVAAISSGTTRAVVAEVFADLARPVFLTSLTTAIGFGSLVASPMRPIQAFGAFTALGVGCTMVLSFSFLPAVLVLLPRPRRRLDPAAPLRSPRGGQALAWLGDLGALGARRRWALLGTVAVVIAVGAVGLQRLEVDANVLSNLDPGSDVHRADRLLNEVFPGSTILSVIVEADPDGAFRDPERLAVLAELQRFAEGLPGVGASRSVVDVLRAVRGALTGQGAAATLPATEAEIGKLLRVLRFSGRDDVLRGFVTDDLRRAHVQIRLRTGSTAAIGEVRAAVRAHLDSELGGGALRATIGGTANLVHLVLRMLVRGQVTSLLVSGAGMLLVCSLVFRSATAGVLCVVPISVATFLNFGFMGLAGTPLDPTTAITSGIGIGVGIDYTIHFLHRYTRAFAGGGGFVAASAETMRTTGLAIAVNAVVVAAGFAVLTLSSFPPVRNLGVLVSIIMVTSSLGAATLLPATLAIVRPGFLRDLRRRERSRGGAGEGATARAEGEGA